MSVYVHKLLKENNSFLLLHDLYHKQNATMYELVEDTQLSQSSVRNLLRKFETDKIVESIGVEKSTGGRCPICFSLASQSFVFFCGYVHKDYIEYRIVQLDKTIEEGQIHFENHHEIRKHFDELMTKYSLQCFVLAVEGIVNGQHYYTDHEKNYDTHVWIEQLQEQIGIPIYVENDVKVMQQGIYKESEHLKNFVFLYLNHLGMACSTMRNGELLQGSKGMIGELGLLPFENITINEAIRICDTQAKFHQLLVYLLAIISTSLDPERILISSQLAYDLDIEYACESLKNIVHQNYLLECVDEPVKRLFDGLEYIGIIKILKTRIGAEL